MYQWFLTNFPFHRGWREIGATSQGEVIPWRIFPWYIHLNWDRQYPPCCHGIQGHLVASVGKALRIHEMGKKKLLWKAENKVSIHTIMSVHFVHIHISGTCNVELGRDWLAFVYASHWHYVSVHRHHHNAPPSPSTQHLQVSQTKSFISNHLLWTLAGV
jgi:hypothetical protein